MFVLSFKSNAQFDASMLLPEAKAIISFLQIPIRDSIKYDGRIKTKISDSLYFFKKGFGIFYADSGYSVIDTFMATRIYPYPTLVVARDIDSILSESIDTSIYWETYAKGVVLHELTHYLQTTYNPIKGVDRSKLRVEDYVKLPDEKEGFSVLSYYFLQTLAPDILLSINKSPLSIDEKREAIIDAYFIFFTPERKSIFKRME